MITRWHTPDKTSEDYQAIVNALQDQADREYPVPVRIELFVVKASGSPHGSFIAVLPDPEEGQ